MNKDYTHISIVLDKSGSMGPLKNDTIKGFNHFLEGQKKLPGKLTLSLLQFDTENRQYFNFQDIKEVTNLDEKSYEPYGGTALYDAIMKSIEDTGVVLNRMPEAVRPSKVLLVIITDGEENSSKYFVGMQGQLSVKNSIEHQRSVYNWETVFLGADPTVVQQASTLGLQRGSMLNYSSNELFGQLTPGEYVMCSYSALGSGLACARNAEKITSGSFFSNVGLTESEAVNKV